MLADRVSGANTLWAFYEAPVVTKARECEEHTRQLDMATSLFGQESHVSVDRRYRFIYRQIITNDA